jgi:hypothetical protein
MSSPYAPIPFHLLRLHFSFPVLAQKSHVKPRNHVKPTNESQSRWHFSFTQPAILKTVERKQTAQIPHEDHPVDNKYFSHNPSAINILQPSTPCKPLNL